jgi:ABC-type polysaccharide/polyol phosphate export permease
MTLPSAWPQCPSIYQYRSVLFLLDTFATPQEIADTIMREIAKQFQVLKDFVVRDLRGRYVGSAMGLVWSLVVPLVNLAVFTFIFSVVLRVNFQAEQGVANFTLYLFCGMIPWLAFQESVMRGTNCIVENANLIKRVAFPVLILPAYLVISSLINELIGLTILLLAIFITMKFMSIWILLLPLLLALQLLFTLGIVCALAALNVFFRDISHLTSASLMVWMYITPIFYPTRLVPEKFRFLMAANPMTHLIQAYRDIFLNNCMPEWRGLLIFGIFAIMSASFGLWIFNRTRKSFADMI